MHMVEYIRATWNLIIIRFVCRKLDKGIGKRNGKGVVLGLHTTDFGDWEQWTRNPINMFLVPAGFQTCTLAPSWRVSHPGSPAFPGAIRKPGKPLVRHSCLWCSFLPSAFIASILLQTNCLLANLWWSLGYFYSFKWWGFQSKDRILAYPLPIYFHYCLANLYVTLF